jgi:hypothetical protein
VRSASARSKEILAKLRRLDELKRKNEAMRVQIESLVAVNSAESARKSSSSSLTNADAHRAPPTATSSRMSEMIRLIQVQLDLDEKIAETNEIVARG